MGDTRLSYADLDARAAHLARHLAARGVGPGALVGVGLPRSPALPVALLAVLRLGAADLPLDPDYPRDRLVQTAQDAGLGLILVGHEPEAARHAAFRDTAAALLALDPGGAPAEGQPDLPDLAPAAPIDPDALAYVIYSSGSTGRPKGVMIPHRALANILASMAEDPGLHARDSILALTSLSFDIAVLELLLPLTVGARIVLASRVQARDPDALDAPVRRHAVDVVQAPRPPGARWAAGGACRRWCGGEALPADLARALAGTRGAVRAWTLLEAETVAWFFAQYLRDEADRHDWRFAPREAADVSGVSSALIVLPACDPLLDEGRAYGERLRAAGVSVTSRIVPGMVNEFLRMGNVVEDALAVRAEIAAALAAAFGQQPAFGQLPAFRPRAESADA